MLSKYFKTFLIFKTRKNLVQQNNPDVKMFYLGWVKFAEEIGFITESRTDIMEIALFNH